ncbi:hypothetical protein VTG60DRAFT_2812 [Thermothelomyces hinnuleus]
MIYMSIFKNIEGRNDKEEASHRDDATEKPKEDSDMVAPEDNPPPGPASGDGGDNRAGQDHWMKEVLEEARWRSPAANGAYDFGGAVVQVGTNVIYDVDATSPAHLFSMWTTFVPPQIPASHITSSTLKKCTIPRPTDASAPQIALASSSNESAIEDEEGWESAEEEESGRSRAEDNINFERVDVRTCPQQRQSLISVMLIHAAPRSALPNPMATLNPSLVASPIEVPLMMKRSTLLACPIYPINKVSRSAPQQINVTATGMHSQAPPLSQRTTRRNMLATELFRILRENIRYERCQNTPTANTVLKRRHTSCDVANLKQYPEKPFMKKDKDVDTKPKGWVEYLDDPFKHQVEVCAGYTPENDGGACAGAARRLLALVAVEDCVNPETAADPRDLIGPVTAEVLTAFASLTRRPQRRATCGSPDVVGAPARDPVFTIRAAPAAWFLAVATLRTARNDLSRSNLNQFTCTATGAPPPGNGVIANGPI